MPVCEYAPRCYRVNAQHWQTCEHPGQTKPLPRPSVHSWLAATGNCGVESNEHPAKDHSCTESTLSRFTPRKAAPEQIPETPSSECKAPSCTQKLQITDEICDLDEVSVKKGRSLQISCQTAGTAKRRPRVLESSDEEDICAAKSKQCSAPTRKKKRAISADSSDEEPVVIDVDVGGARSSGSSGGGTSVDLTVTCSPQDVAVSGLDEDHDKIDESDTVLDGSVNDLISKCEEVGEGLRKQVELAVIEQPKCVGGENLRLKKYQLVGLSWLNNLHMQGVNGILADEMGLGKTIQSIAFLGHLQSSGNQGPHLIVSPASTLENWKRELNLWLPSAAVSVYHGTLKERENMRRKMLHPDVILTTYSYFQTESAKQDRAFLRRFDYGCMVLDEGHSIKNSDAARNRRLMQLTYKRCILLTGTPINNNLPELLALLQFILPDFFEGEGMQELQELCSRADKGGPTQDGGAKGLVERIRVLMDPFVLRRRKADVLGELVPKVDRVHMIDAGAAQRRIYDGVLERWRRERSATRKLEGRAITSLFTELRKAANHPLLVRSRVSDRELGELASELHRREHFGDQCTREMVLKELQGYNDYEISKACRSYRPLSRYVLPASAVAESAKFVAIKGLLADAREGGHRVLIFSQWTSMLDLLEDFLEEEGVCFLRLDGSTPVKERQELIDQYNRDESVLVFLLSTRAGGLGINLTAADTVILHDLDFNPQADRQAEDRCHRIGQLRPVHVHRLVSRETVDENIFRIADRKRRLADDMLGEGGGGGEEFADDGEPSESVQRIIESCLAKYLED